MINPLSTPRILVTGGAGFIGSHTCVELLNAGYNVVVIDDFSNSSPIAIDRVCIITGADENRLALVEGSILDRSTLEHIFTTWKVAAIIHFASFKAVGESVQKPLEYYHNNIIGTLELCDVARTHSCKNRLLEQRNGIRRSGIRSNRRKVPAAPRDQPVRSHESND